MRRKSSKVFIRSSDDTVEFMWANVLTDGSVKMGLLSDGTEEIELAVDPIRGEIRKPNLFTEQKLGRSEVTFHPSGKYKLTGRMGLHREEFDRATVEGPPLAAISEPRRMLEVVLPRVLPEPRLTPQAGDIVLTVAEGSNLPLRCTISCMAKEEATRFVDSSGVFFVETSAWESTAALENDSHVWTWTLRSSRNDQHFSEKLYMMLLGPVKWGNRSP